MRRGLLDAASLQEMLYRALDGSDDLVVIVEEVGEGADGLVIAATNEAFCRASGWASADLIGKPFGDLAAPDADPSICQTIVQAAHDRCSCHSELLCRRNKGASFWLGLHLMPVAQSTPSCCVILGRDITDSLRDRQQHAAIQGLLAKVFVSVHAAVAIVDEHGIILMSNPALGHLLGDPPGGLVGRQALEFITPEARATAHEARTRQLATGESYRIEAHALRADGAHVPIEIASTIVEREDLKRFRIITATPLPPRAAEPAVKVHIAGKIRLLGLEDVKASLGSRWPAVAARVMRSAEHVIRRRCGPHDTWSRTADSGFLICFGEASEEEAAFRAAAIARDIRSRLIGEGETSPAAYVSAVTAAVALPDGPDRGPDALADAITQRLNARLAEIEGRARATLALAMQEASCELTALHGRSLRDAVGHFATLPGALEHRLQSALTALPRHEAEAFDFDRLVLATAAERVVGMLGSGNPLPILVAVDFEVFLDRRTTERYVAACQALDERLRQHLVLVITRLPHGVPRNRVLECVMRLRPFCHAVGFQAHGLELPPIEFALLSGSIVAVPEEQLNRWEPDDMAKFERLVGTVRAHRGHVLVRQVNSRENAQRLLKLGADLIAMENA